MPMQLLIDPRQPVAVLRVSGPFSLMDWSAALAGLVVRPRPRGPMRIILDRRATPVVDSPQFAWTMASLVAEHRGEFEGGRWATLVADRPTCYGISRIFTAGLEYSGLDGAAFRDSDSAVAWLLDGDEAVEAGPVAGEVLRWLERPSAPRDQAGGFRVGPSWWLEERVA